MSIQYGRIVLVFSIFLISSCVTTDSIEQLQRQITSLNSEVNILKKTSLDTKASTGANYDTVMEEVKKIRGSYEENKYEFERKSEEIAVLKEVINRTAADIETRLYDIEQRLSAIEKKLAVTPSSEPTGTTPPPSNTGGTIKPVEPTSTAPPKTTLTPEELYAAGYRKFQDKDYDGAELDFRNSIASSPGSSLADNAQFWIGEIYYAQKEYERAILEYDTVIKKYPSGDKVPAAMLKEGFAFLELNDTAHARTIFSELIKKYPKEPQADTARKKLETL
ncbi:MAG: tol-pal system protein YbgF [Deltaproteobacteria bacterium]|nr:tol-pal system protein YbgF [Candidatus Zymogenaceae bacterium]